MIENYETVIGCSTKQLANDFFDVPL